MFTTLVLKYGTTFANLFVIWIAVTHFVIRILLLAFHENKPVKMILLAVRGICFIAAIITTFVMIGEDVKLYALVGWVLIILALIFAVIRVVFAEWHGATYSSFWCKTDEMHFVDGLNCPFAPVWYLLFVLSSSNLDN
jgi:hypothetical protein